MRARPIPARRTRSAALAAVALLAAVVATLFVAAPATTQEPDEGSDLGSDAVSDTISIVKEGEDLTNAEIAVRLVEETVLASDVDTVIIGRDDVFVDSLASATMQDDSVLLLVPPNGPISPATFDVLADLDPERIVLLGGPLAISTGVEETLVDRGYAVERRFGPSRFETAVAVAEQEAPDATTAILARAFPAEGAADATQAFADALSAGGWAADRGWIVLLTQTEVLTGATREYLVNSAITRVEIMGGTAAISEAVERELVDLGLEVARTAGATRFGTAVEVAEKRGADDAAQAARVVLVDGQADDAWAGGFASAAHSATFDAPIVLANGETIPGSTASWLAGMGQAYAQEGGPGIRLTCVTLPATCEQARELMGLPGPAEVAFSPPDGSTVERGGTISVTATDPAGRLTGGFTVSGPCAVAVSTALDEQGRALARIPGDAPLGGCVVTWELAFDTGAVQTATVTYTVVDPPPPPPPPPSPSPTPFGS
jgi:putative cell wall-binding protein